MKKETKYFFLFIVVLFFLLGLVCNAFAVTIAGSCSDFGEYEADARPYLNSSGLAFDALVTALQGQANAIFGYPVITTGCSQTGGSVRVLAPQDILGVDSSVYVVPLVRMAVCCLSASDVLANRNGIGKYESDVMSQATVTGVPLGQEKQAAETYCNSWSPNNPYPAADSNFVRTDGLNGYSYIAGMSADNQTVDIQVSCWKRGGYTKDGGSIVPLGSIGSGGGTSTIDYAQFKTAVQSALDSSVVVQDLLTTSQAIRDKPSSAGLNFEDTELAHEDALNNAFGTGNVFSGGLDSVGASESVSPVSSSLDTGSYSADLPEALPQNTYGSIPTQISNFFSSNPVASIFSEKTKIQVTPGSCSFSTSVYGSNVSISFCELTDVLSLLGSIVVAVATIYAILISWGVS